MKICTLYIPMHYGAQRVGGYAVGSAVYDLNHKITDRMRAVRRDSSIKLNDRRR